ncbi:MAG: type II toxin-antitoxin system VapC family toxin [Kiritimatiellia bacterium]
MTGYYDTGILVKLYTVEPESAAVQAYVMHQAGPIPFHALHHSEIASAFHLKAFRGECSSAQANRALTDVEEDRRSGILLQQRPDWEKIWEKCLELSCAHAASTGCRTLDTLHVACAVELGYREFVTSDQRQAALAERLGITVCDPTVI